ncbi:MAG: class I SAM-dependent methyltransferase [Chlorobiaceae bacterium]|nr:class I SAM-dependent methyltransferase [Chlorobiaceae bacterium]NTW74815.1 class I SAM-dependent methyltransferase [Chlorobiaceae bacterium]
MTQKSFRTLVDREWCSDPAHALRWQKTIVFLRGSDAAARPVASGLDVGDRTPMTGMLESLFGCRFENTTIDLDVDPIEGSYPVATAFEVLEHLYNPLHLLLELRKSLSPVASSRLFVSTPAWKPGFLQSPDHFHEMSRRSIESLFERAGFSVVRFDEFRLRPFLFCLTGIRPLLRCLFEKIRVYELTVRS